MPENEFVIEYAELAEIREARRVAADRIEVLRKQVAPYYESRRWLANAINVTHDSVRNHRGDFVVYKLLLDASACEQRRDLFPRLDALRAEYAPALGELRFEERRCKEFEKQIAHIEAWIAKKRRREDRTR